MIFGKVLAGVIALVLLTALPASAGPGPVYRAPRAYYLALGDSIAYGFQPAKAGLPPSGFRTGYVDLFAARLRALAPKIRVVNYGCPGESTTTFVDGKCPWLGEGKRLHDAFKGPQLGAALAFLRARRGQVSPITLTLWGNDVLGAEFSGACKDFACIRAHWPRSVAQFASRLRSILHRLRAAAPKAEIIVSGAWNFDNDNLEQGDLLFRSLDATIAREAAGAQARFADVLPAFNPPGSLSREKARLCALTFICSKDDVHPTDAGYRAIAAAVLTASGYTRHS